VTILDDPKPTASGTTTQPEPPPNLPDVDQARHFYLYGYGTGAMSAGTWTVVHYGPATGSGYYGQPEPSRQNILLESALRRLILFRRLPPRWDGYRAKVITQEAVYSAAWILGAVLDDDSELPQFYPLPDGGIQIDWYADTQIEIEVDGAGEAHVLGVAANGDVLVEGPFDPQAPSDITATVKTLVKDVSAQLAAEQHPT
jgi:hypothetical protein